MWPGMPITHINPGQYGIHRSQQWELRQLNFRVWKRTTGSKLKVLDCCLYVLHIMAYSLLKYVIIGTLKAVVLFWWKSLHLGIRFHKIDLLAVGWWWTSLIQRSMIMAPDQHTQGNKARLTPAIIFQHLFRFFLLKLIQHLYYHRPPVFLFSFPSQLWVRAFTIINLPQF